jgi:16S rRNA (cytosine967-C5)-methyltransferase
VKHSSLLGHVCELLELIRPLKQPADTVTQEFFRQRRYLGSKDRRFISEATFGILRNFTLARFHAREAFASLAVSSLSLDEASRRPIALYSSFAAKIRLDDAAALLADVESTWRISFPDISCAEFVGALVRSQLTPAILQNPVKRIATVHSFPEVIVQEWIERFGLEETERLCATSNQPAPTVIRVNSLKATVEECRARLSAEGIESEPTRLSPDGLTLQKRINIQASRAFKDGWFEIQDEGSQLISLVLDPKPRETIIDACAGGGGKTLHLGALMRNHGELHAIDIDMKRLQHIQPRLRRAGVSFVQRHRASDDCVRLLRGKGDGVLVDAPCSGVGTFRRNPDAKLRFDAAVVERMVEVQKRILDSSASLVKPGGRLVYSTCTLLRQENEEVVETFLEAHPEFHTLSAPKILLAQEIEIESASDYLVLSPHRANTDGFFAAVFRRD